MPQVEVVDGMPTLVFSCMSGDLDDAGRLVRHEERWYLLGFRNLVAGEFVGELADPTR